MRAIVAMFDTLSRRFLQTWGANKVQTPNFSRLEEHCAVFDSFYAGSLPCMPARRELHTGRYNFLHRSWGPLEPFDCSVMETLRAAGIYTHLVTDHSHYFEDGGATYHNRYDTWEGFRGQEGDRWTPRRLSNPALNVNPHNKQGVSTVQHLANRSRMRTEEEMPSVRTISAGLEFLEAYQDADNWLLQVECFDPHEPFYVPEKYRAMYGCGDSTKTFYWPPYRPVGEIEESELDEARREYAALITMCDFHLGRILDFMDAHDMWKDTMLVVNTDHGFLIGEHGFMGKNYMPQYEELVRLPFYLHDPRNPQALGRRQSLAQTIDIAPTLLAYFGAEPDAEMDGKDLSGILNDDTPVRSEVLFGMHGGHTNLSDGRYVLMQASVESNSPLYERTLMPTNIRGYFSREQLRSGVLEEGSRYSNGIPCVRYPAATYANSSVYGTKLYDLQADPEQEHPLEDPVRLREMQQKLVGALQKAGAPEEEYIRLGLE